MSAPYVTGIPDPTTKSYNFLITGPVGTSSVGITLGGNPSVPATPTIVSVPNGKKS